MIASFGSFAVTVVFALYNGFLGAYHASLWHGTICVYYLVLSILRGLIIFSERKLAKRGGRDRSRQKVCVVSSALLLVLNASLSVPVFLMVIRQKPVNMSLIPAITMAAYTTYKLTAASINLKKRKMSASSLIRLLRTIGFIDALVSILTLQNTLIMVSARGESTEMLTLSAITGGAVMLTILALAVANLAASAAKLRRQK
ncbi:MAG: hypothetical protein IKP26_06660 [Clostridia bacterium]|nr:hypothetical protein [Clostridia bacterium]